MSQLYHLIFILLFAAGTIVLVNNIIKQKNAARSILHSQHKNYILLQNAIEDVVSLVVEIMDTTTLEINNERKLIAKLRSSFLAEELSYDSLLHKLPALANVYRFGVIDYLRREYPSLTQDEIELCSIIALGVSPGTVGKAIGFEHNGTLYNKRTKIRRKITEIPSEITLESFIESTAARLKLEHESKMNSNLKKLNLDDLFTERIN